MAKRKTRQSRKKNPVPKKPVPKTLALAIVAENKTIAEIPVPKTVLQRIWEFINA